MYHYTCTRYQVRTCTWHRFVSCVLKWPIKNKPYRIQNTVSQKSSVMHKSTLRLASLLFWGSGASRRIINRQFGRVFALNFSHHDRWNWTKQSSTYYSTSIGTCEAKGWKIDSNACARIGLDCVVQVRRRKEVPFLVCLCVDPSNQEIGIFFTST